MDSFERAAISILRGSNLVVMVLIVGAGFIAALGFADQGPVMAGFVVLGSVLVAGLATGLLALLCQIYENGQQQVTLLRDILDKKNGGSL